MTDALPGPVNHLGDRLSAFVDSELDHDARERVLVHLARCADCRQCVDAERKTKSRLTAASGPDLPPGLAATLAGIATTPRPRHVVRPQRRRHRRRRRVAATSGAVLVGAMSAAFAVGGGPAEGSPVTPNVSRYTVEHGVVSDEVVPLTDRGGSAVAVSFTIPGIP
jgi:anti-sigma factor RsiW